MNKTCDLDLVTFVVAEGHARVKAIEGKLGQRVFVLDRDVSDEVTLAFPASPAARILTTFRALKRAVHAPTG